MRALIEKIRALIEKMRALIRVLSGIPITSPMVIVTLPIPPMLAFTEINRLLTASLVKLFYCWRIRKDFYCEFLIYNIYKLVFYEVVIYLNIE